MSLTTDDLDQIRTVVREEVNSIVSIKLESLEGRIEALENDVKEIYSMLTRIEKLLTPDTTFQKLTIENRLLKLNRNLLVTAKQAGVTLPR